MARKPATLPSRQVSALTEDDVPLIQISRVRGKWIVEAFPVLRDTEGELVSRLPQTGAAEVTPDMTLGKIVADLITVASAQAGLKIDPEPQG